MANRKQYIDDILESMHILKHGLIRNGAKGGRLQITPSQWLALAIVGKRGNIGIKDIARELLITSSAATQLVDELVNKGYLTREDNANDRRTLILKVSDKHKKRMAEIKIQKMKKAIGIFAVLTDRELAQYAALSKKIADALNK